MSCYGTCALDGNDASYMRRVFEPLINKAVSTELRRQLGPAVGKRRADYIEYVENLNRNDEVIMSVTN